MQKKTWKNKTNFRECEVQMNGTVVVMNGGRQHNTLAVLLRANNNGNEKIAKGGRFQCHGLFHWTAAAELDGMCVKLFRN